MFAEATSMTSVIVDLITRERKTPKYMTKGGRVGMTQARFQRSTPVARATGAAVVEEEAE